MGMKILQTVEFTTWLTKLRDREARKRILKRVRKLESHDYFGVTRGVGGHVSEMKIDYGPGYRIYYTRRGETIVLLLLGGDKDTQQRDILEAQSLAATLDEEGRAWKSN
jgi:putative addiction module killer protein